MWLNELTQLAQSLFVSGEDINPVTYTPLMITAMLALFAFGNGFVLSNERRKPLVAMTGLAMTVLAIMCMFVSPEQLTRSLVTASMIMPVTGVTVLDTFLFGGFVLAAVFVWIFLVRTEPEREAEHELAAVASFANRAIIRVALFGSMAYVAVTVASGGLSLAMLRFL
jgi:hypothetical protein